MTTPIINIFEKVARKAGKIMVRDFGELENLQIHSKSLGDYVTNADIKIEEIIIDSLKYYYPSSSFITEEFLTSRVVKLICTVSAITRVGIEISTESATTSSVLIGINFSS